jgi:hypothetical protein
VRNKDFIIMEDKDNSGVLAMVVLLALVVLVAWMFTSCSTVKETHIYSTDTLRVERLVPVVLPADSSAIHALLRCNENGRVIIEHLESVTSENAALSFRLDSMGWMDTKTVVRHDTVWVKSDTVRITTASVDEVVVEKQLSWWDSWMIGYGKWALIATVVVIVVGLVKLRIKN